MYNHKMLYVSLPGQQDKENVMSNSGQEYRWNFEAPAVLPPPELFEWT